MPRTSNAPIQERARQTRRKILDAARNLFGEVGFGASLDQIVEAAGVSKGALFYHFPDGKEEMIREVLAETASKRKDLADLPALLEKLLRDPDARLLIENALRYHYSSQAET